MSCMRVGDSYQTKTQQHFRRQQTLEKDQRVHDENVGKKRRLLVLIMIYNDIKVVLVT